MAKRTNSPFFWLTVLAVVGFAVLLLTQRQLFYDTWEVLQTADLALILLLPVMQVVNYTFIGGYYRTMFGFFETKISIARSWGVVASMNFVNQILPSGGLSGITYLAYGFRAKTDVGKTTVVQIGRYIFAFASYAAIGPIAFLLLIQAGDGSFIGEILDKIQDSPVAIITALLFVSFLIMLTMLFRSSEVAKSLVERLRRSINWGGRLFGKDELIASDTANKLVDDFHEGLDFFKGERRRIIQPYFYMLLSTFMELMIVFVSLKAVGSDVSFAAVFASFLAANVAGVISIIPGDVGVHEAVMTTMLVAFGVDAPTALSAVLLYRVFNKVIFLPIGFYFYTVLLKPATKAKSAKKQT